MRYTLVLNRVGKWFLVIGLSLNILKTNIMKLFISKMIHLYLSTWIKNLKLTNIKFLCLEIDKHPEWNIFIEQIIPNLNNTSYDLRIADV